MSSQLGAAKRLATELLEDPDYRANFKKRLLAGELAPNLEVLVWYYRFGKPVDQVVVKQIDEDLSDKTNIELLQTIRELEKFLKEDRTNDAVPTEPGPSIH